MYVNIFYSFPSSNAMASVIIISNIICAPEFLLDTYILILYLFLYCFVIVIYPEYFLVRDRNRNNKSLPSFCGNFSNSSGPSENQASLQMQPPMYDPSQIYGL